MMLKMTDVKRRDGMICPVRIFPQWPAQPGRPPWFSCPMSANSVAPPHGRVISCLIAIHVSASLAQKLKEFPAPHYSFVEQRHWEGNPRQEPAIKTSLSVCKAQPRFMAPVAVVMYHREITQVNILLSMKRLDALCYSVQDWFNHRPLTFIFEGLFSHYPSVQFCGPVPTDSRGLSSHTARTWWQTRDRYDYKSCENCNFLCEKERICQDCAAWAITFIPPFIGGERRRWDLWKMTLDLQAVVWSSSVAVSFYDSLAIYFT